MKDKNDSASWQDWLVDSGDRGMLGFVLDLAECAWILCVGVGGWASGRVKSVVSNDLGRM